MTGAGRATEKQLAANRRNAQRPIGLRATDALERWQRLGGGEPSPPPSHPSIDLGGDGDPISSLGSAGDT